MVAPLALVVDTDALLLFTDGVTERRNESDDEFGESRLIDLAHGARGSCAQEMLRTLGASIKEFGGQAVLQDDLTIVVLKRDVKV